MAKDIFKDGLRKAKRRKKRKPVDLKSLIVTDLRNEGLPKKFVAELFDEPKKSRKKIHAHSPSASKPPRLRRSDPSATHQMISPKKVDKEAKRWKKALKKLPQPQAKELKALRKVRDCFDSLPEDAALEYMQELFNELKQSLKERRRDEVLGRRER